MLSSLLLLALLAAAQGRAVNISNTWVLPEEGFPVFYRYFRDRISWYEADAVCQFHHANLVTVDTTAQYDAVRAYLKELDISSVVWVGLIRSNPDGDFTWTDYRGLSGDGYWSSAPDARASPLCAAADPAADYRWEARACGGPTVASFICELPVPQWALTSEGCMVRALPALTVLYLPESAAVQLTADCGLAGVKRVQCTGNVNHEDLLRDLSCNEDDDSSLPTSTSSWTTSEIDQGTNDATIEDNITTEHEGDVSTWNDITSTPDLFRHISVGPNKVKIQQQIELGQDNTVLPNKNINLDISLHNNLQSNDIPKHIVLHDDMHSDDQLEKQEDEKHMQHKLLHNELARLGNIENIFTQPTDHFVPPLVMAKAKANDDMTAISFEEKLAQQHIEHEVTKDSNTSTNINSKIVLDDSTTVSTTTTLLKSTTNVGKDKHKINKYILPKKYNQTSAEIKSKVEKLPIKLIKSTKPSTISTQTGTSNTDTETTTSKSVVYYDPANEDNLLDLTVIIKEPELIENDTNMNFNMSKTSNRTNNYGSLSNTRDNKEITTLEIITSKPYEFNTESDEIQNMTLNDEIIKITFIHDDDRSVSNSTVFEITTKMPIFKDNSEDVVHMSSTHSSKSTIGILNSPTSASDIENIELNNEVVSSSFSKNMTNLSVTDLNEMNAHETESSRVTYGKTNTTFSTPETLTEHKKEIDTNGTPSKVIHHINVKESINDFTESENLDYVEKNDNDTSQYIDDFQSPLLSGANEPLHKPNRSRRPQQQNRIKKFNPFRILG